MLQVEHLDGGYEFLQVLWDVSLEIEEGEFVALIGPNGAGKTTVLKTICGLVPAKGGEVSFNGRPITRMAPHNIARMGISYISQDLNLFTAMSVRENLLLGAYAVPDRQQQLQTLDKVYGLFPRLQEREGQLAGTMSGGERKMLAIARGMMCNPHLLLVDEPSLGLAPHLVTDVFHSLQQLQRSGATILMVEQLVHASLAITDRAYVLESGRIAMQGPSAELKSNEHVQSAYLGV